jgi:hypothetical protein
VSSQSEISPRGTNSPQSRILGQDEGGHELHRLELGSGERADQQPKRHSQHPVRDRQQRNPESRSRGGQIEHQVSEAGCHRRLQPRKQRERDPVSDKQVQL